MTNSELGLKFFWFDNSLRVNAAVFAYKYDNLQKLEFIEGECLASSSTGACRFETSDLEGHGMEPSVNGLPIPPIGPIFNTGLLDSEYTCRQAVFIESL